MPPKTLGHAGTEEVPKDDVLDVVDVEVELVLAEVEVVEEVVEDVPPLIEE
jgi:hypothetical protein